VRHPENHFVHKLAKTSHDNSDRIPLVKFQYPGEKYVLSLIAITMVDDTHSFPGAVGLSRNS